MVSAGANTALSNLASVAINASLISDTTATDDLGSSSIRWLTAYVTTLDALIASATTNAPVTVTSLTANTTSTAAAGFGPALDFFAETTTTEAQAAGRISAVWTDAAHPTRDSAMRAYYALNGTLTLGAEIGANYFDSTGTYPAHFVGAGSTKGVILGNSTTDRPAISPGSATYLQFFSGSTALLFSDNAGSTGRGSMVNAGYWRFASDWTAATARVEIDNGAIAQSILVLADNGTPVLTVANGGAVSFTSTLTATGAGSLGWTVASAANQACTTTCASSKAMGGFDSATALPVGPADATADACYCAGS